ncbi:5'/3'-nucleotidase SurE [Alloalcanivorax mobilis]|uniref:5'/3'-nucleotidase SurE n=1 Tax=Alloalcanivorax mobilis TaxID=2019569 RepID=UPI000B5B2812|nr:5'/3'-nucleotidase SurE [Alloalcanivorax mobilis]ASK33589.1 5'/3'-nucleotidase SurE [Alcanivorax sp. N3-2A]|tara:strand:+ start:37715 stop:38509 length:795 start_codon:yes stop_codon:yes gene_type:complete
MSKPFRKILLTNDDGIAAPGLLIAEQIAAELADEVWVVAPEHDQSGVGQGISLHTPLRAYHHGERRFAVSGTPADCVMFAMAEWFSESAPDLVLSGVNCGANLSDSVMYSGTVGAVLAAAHLGLPGIALSQAFRDRDQVDFTPTRHYSAGLIRDLWEQGADRTGYSRACWNINYPELPIEQIHGGRITRQIGGGIVGPRLVAGTDGRGLPYRWLSFERDPSAITDPQSDVVALRDGYVSVMPLHPSRCDDNLADSGFQAGELRL